MKVIKKIILAILWIILILLATFNIYNFVSIKLLHKDLSSVGGYAMLEVVSGSMEPTIMVGDLIIIDTNWKNYQISDIITFKDVNGSFVTHRIIEKNADKMITQGDANPSPDEEMSTNTIVGKYLFKIPGGGKLMASLKNPLVMGLILVIGILVCFLVSTDNELTPVDMTEEEKEFLEYKKNKAKVAKETPKKEVLEGEVKTVKKATLPTNSPKTTKKTVKTTKNKKVATKRAVKKVETPKKETKATTKKTPKTVGKKAETAKATTTKKTPTKTGRKVETTKETTKKTKKKVSE